MADVPKMAEQDPVGSDALPTYDDLTVQNGPNSRFGRWREWIEKRAAERYDDIPPEEMERRRARGWEREAASALEEHVAALDLTDPPPASPLDLPQPSPLNLLPKLQISTGTPKASPSFHASQSTLTPANGTDYPTPLKFHTLSPTHLNLNQFGSRFLPHSTSPIRCALPMLSDRLILIGHDDGLSVINMFPQEWQESGGLATKGPEDAQVKVLWEGEGVFQMTLLEHETDGSGGLQGVLLALVGPSPDSGHSEGIRSLRMYNLGSLVSLAKWTIAQQTVRPLQLHRSPNWNSAQSPTTPKKSRPESKIGRSIKTFMDSPHHHRGQSSNLEHQASYSSLLSPSPTTSLSGHSSTTQTSHTLLKKSSSNSTATVSRSSTIDSWDVVDDLPLRWATNYVALATPGSRLANSSVLYYDLWRDPTKGSNGAASLVVVIKNNILLYETPKGERAFVFVKEFYTPLPPRAIKIVQQAAQEGPRGPSESPGRNNHQRQSSTSTLRVSRSSSSPPPMNPSMTLTYSTQLSLFVVFDKKAGWIRLADSVVGEVELVDDLDPSKIMLSLSTHSLKRVNEVMAAQIKGSWLLPVSANLPIWPPRSDAPPHLSVYFLTRGKETHILPSPLPAKVVHYPPLRILTWNTPPTSVSARVCHRTSRPSTGGDGPTPYLQLVAFGDDGVEVQELSLSFLSKGKGKARSDDIRRASADINGATGKLCGGGHWERPHPHIKRAPSSSSVVSAKSFDSLETNDGVAQLQAEEGIYGWCQKGLNDYRIFWVGGSARETDKSNTT